MNLHTLKLKATHVYRLDQYGVETKEYMETAIRVVGTDGCPAHSVCYTHRNRHPFGDLPEVTDADARQLGQLFASAPHFLRTLCEIGAGELDGESSEGFADRCRKLANYALQEWGGA